MDEEPLVAPNVEPSAPGESTTPQTPDIEIQGEQQPEPATQPEKVDKQVPLRELIDERSRRKQAEEYNRSLLKQMAPSEAPVAPVAKPGKEAPDTEYVDIDPDKFMTRSEYEFQTREQSSWVDAKNEFAEQFKQIPMLEDLAEGYRQRAILSGNFYTPKEAVSQIVKNIITDQRVAGQRAATESITIQQQSAIQGAGTKADSSLSEINSLKEGLTSRDRRTRDASLKELLKRGAI